MPEDKLPEGILSVHVFWHFVRIPLYKVINSLAPIALPDYITFAEATQSRHTRITAATIGGCDTTTLYYSIRPNCDAFRDGFFYRELKAWNNLPVDIRQAEGKSIAHLWSASNVWPGIQTKCHRTKCHNVKNGQKPQCRW